MRQAILIILLCSCIVRVSAQHTALDSTFGNNGVLMIDSPVMMQNNRIALQADGKIVMAGTYYYYLLPSFDMVYEMRILRLLQNGRLDSTFNGTGVITKATLRSTRLAALNIQTDGKILVTGSTGILERYLPDGMPDLTFNDSGRIELDYLGPYDYLTGTTLQPDGKIITTGVFQQQYILVARFKSDGRPDSTFGYWGKVTTILDGSNNASGEGVVVQAGGRIVVAGSCNDGPPSYNNYFAVVGYLPDGGLDPLFNNGKGYIRFGFENLDHSSASTIELMPGGKIMVGGTSNIILPGSQQYIVCRTLARLTQNGTLDNTFNVTGRLVVDSVLYPTVGSYWSPPAFRLQHDGKIVLINSGDDVSDNAVFSLLRLDSTGRRDYTYGDSGRVVTDITPNKDVPWDIAIQADGRILVAGVADQDTTWPLSLHSAPTIVRYMPNVNLGIPPPDTGLYNMMVFPNPARDVIKLQYNLAKAGDISIQLYNIQGQLVQQWTDHEARTAGNHSESLPLKDALAAGTYLLSVQAVTDQRAFVITRE